MLHLWEPLAVVPKPLLVHAAAEACGALTRRHLRRQARFVHVLLWVQVTRVIGVSTPSPSSISIYVWNIHSTEIF